MELNMKFKKKQPLKGRAKLYYVARLLGDFTAIKKGRVLKRLGRRTVGGQMRKALRGMFH
jgi:hypothetical protein